MHVVVIDTPPLGDRSYLVHDGEVGLVVDPQRDVDRVEAAARAAGIRITHVAETHVHNDYLTGGLVLARQHGARYLVNAADQVSYERTPVEPGQAVAVGRLVVEAVATPGHTDTHLAYVVRDGDASAAFSGGSLLYGTVGRTDLVAEERAAELAAAQHASVRRLAEAAGPTAGLYPTHGFGSFCAAVSSDQTTTASTIGVELATNHALLDDDLDHFVATLLAGFGDYPTYYAHMGAANAAGPGPADLGLPQPIGPDELRRRIHAGAWVVDVRRRVAYAADHLAGTVGLEYGDGASFTTNLGWVVPHGSAITLVGSYDDVAQAVRDLARIGFDRPAVALGDGPSAVAPELARSTYPRVDWAEALAIRTADDVVLDVRRADEHGDAHVFGAVHVPLHELRSRLGRLPRDRRLLVHCGAGYRASVAASLLARDGFDVVLVDDEFDRAGPAGFPITRP